MITRPTLLKVFLSSFFIQAAWSFEKMQGLGFAASLAPALRRIHGEGGPGVGNAIKRHLAFYNAHPYMASPLLGATIRLEEDAAAGIADPASATGFKTKVMGAYGAIGDAFFWGSLRPLASCAGILATLLWGFWGPLVFLAVYNASHLWMRYAGLVKGYSLGTGVVGFIKSLELPKWGLRCRYLASLLLGIAAALAAWSVPGIASGLPHGPTSSSFVAALAVLVTGSIILNILFRKGMTVSKLVYIVVAPLVIYGIVAY